MLQAYKILAKQEGISNNEAKALIDAGVVSAKGEKIVIARALMSEKTEFKLTRIEKPRIIYEDNDIIALNKPAFAVSEKIAENLAKIKGLTTEDVLKCNKDNCNKLFGI